MIRGKSSKSDLACDKFNYKCIEDTDQVVYFVWKERKILVEPDRFDVVEFDYAKCTCAKPHEITVLQKKNLHLHVPDHLHVFQSTLLSLDTPFVTEKSINKLSRLWQFSRALLLMTSKIDQLPLETEPVARDNTTI